MRARQTLSLRSYLRREWLALLARHARRESDTSRAERPGGSRVACSSARAAGGRRGLACRGAVAAAGHGLPDAGTNGRAARPSTSVAAGPLTAYDMPVGVLADGFSATPRGRDRVAGLDYEDVSRASGSVEQLSLRGGAPILAESKESARRWPWPLPTGARPQLISMARPPSMCTVSSGAAV